MTNIDPNKVGWIPPEQLDRANGEYRVWDDDANDFGDRVLAVTDSDGETTFVAYDETTHGDKYRPSIRQEELDADSA